MLRLGGVLGEIVMAYTQTGSAPRLDNGKVHPLFLFFRLAWHVNLSWCLPGQDPHCLLIALSLRGAGAGRLKKTPDVERDSGNTKKLLNPGEKQHIPPCFPPRLSVTQCGRANTNADVLNWSQRDGAALCPSRKHRNLTCIFSCCIRGQEVDLIHLTAWGRRVDKRKMNRLWDVCRPCGSYLVGAGSRIWPVYLHLQVWTTGGESLPQSKHTFRSCVWKMQEETITIKKKCSLHLCGKKYKTLTTLACRIKDL